MKKTITLSMAIMLSVAIMAQVAPKVKEIKSLSQQKMEQLHSKKHNAKTWHNTMQTTLKSAKSTKHVLDSSLWWEFSTENNQYYLDWKDVFVYNESGMPILFKNYTGNTNLYLFYYDSVYYNANNQVSETVGYYDETESGLTPEKDTRHLYMYDENNRLIQESGFDWDTELNLWTDETWRYEYEYNANGQIETELEYHDDAGVLQFYHKAVKTYNAQSLLSQSITSYWNADQSSWETSYKTTYEYNTDNKLTLEQEFRWENSQWFNSRKTEYTYDTNGHMTQKIEYDWVEESSTFVPYWKVGYEFDANNNLINEIYSDWNNEASNWVDYNKDSYSYDNTVSFEQLILPWADEFESEEEIRLYFNHKLIGGIEYEWDAQSSTWIENGKSEYYYTLPGGGTGVNDNTNHTVTIYPNPVANMLNISLTSNSGTADFELYDAQGRKLISKVISNSEQLNLESLSNGIYFYNLNIDGAKQSGKLIKE